MKFLSIVCLSAIATAIFKLLIPENKLKNQMTALAAGAFLLTVITAASGAEFDFSLENETVYESEKFVQVNDEVNEALRRKICDDMSHKVNNLLNEQGIYPEEIHIIVNISDLYSINITQVKLVLNSQDYVAEKAVEILSAQLSKDIEITTQLKSE